MLIKKSLILVIFLFLFVNIFSMPLFASQPQGEIDPEDSTYKEQVNIEKESEENQKGYKLSSNSPNLYFTGIDISKHNGSNIDWSKVKQSGVKFAFIRVAYSSWSTGNILTDPYYERNIKEASKNGIKVGAYIYSQATNSTEAKNEANYVIKLLNPLRQYINMPVVWDMESPITYVDNGKTHKTHWGSKLPSKLNNSNNWKVFANSIKIAGYIPMFYSYTYWTKDYMDMSVINTDGYPFWLAEYSNKSSPATYHSIYGNSYPFDFWQYSSSGSISGISGKVDLDRWYSTNLNQYSIQEPDNSPYSEKVNIKCSNYTNSSRIYWAHENNATKYVIQYSTNKSSWKNLITTYSSSYVVNNLINGKAYYIRVIPYKNSKKGTVSNTILIHGKLKYNVKDSKGNKVIYKLGKYYYINKNKKAIGKLNIVAKVKVKGKLNLRKKLLQNLKYLLEYLIIKK